MRNAIDLFFCSLVFNIGWRFNVLVGEFSHAHLLLVTGSEFDVTSFSWKHFIAWRELWLGQETLTIASARTKHNFNTTLLYRWSIQALVIFLLKLKQAAVHRTYKMISKREDDGISLELLLTVQRLRNRWQAQSYPFRTPMQWLFHQWVSSEGYSSCRLHYSSLRLRSQSLQCVANSLSRVQIPTTHTNKRR